MRIGIGATVLAVNRRAGKSDGITTYSEALLTSLRSEFPLHDFDHAAFEPGGFPLFNPWRRFEVGAMASVLTGRRHESRAVFGRDYDLFHALDYYIPALTIPVVATIHDACPLSQPELAPATLRRIKNQLFVRKCRFADQVITVSEYSAEEITRYIGIERRKIHVIHEGVAAHVLQEAERAPDWRYVEQKFGLRPGYIVFCGAISKRKNLARLVEAFLLMPPALQRAHTLVLVGGPAKDGLRDGTIARLRGLESSGLVRWLGRLPNDDMARIVRHALVFAFPSLHEGFGLPVIEAFHLGVPVLTSNCSALPEIAGDAALLVNPRDPEHISFGLQQLLTDERARDQLASRGRARASLFSWARCARETFDVYRKSASRAF